jgi:hypothetical protein
MLLWIYLCLDGQSPQPRQVGKFKLAHAGFVGRSLIIIRVVQPEPDIDVTSSVA